MVYCLPAELGVPTTSSPLKNLVLDIDYNDAVVVIHTSPGAAQLIARLLDSLGKAEGILGTIAGDDTIFTTPASGFSVRDLYEAILELLNKSFSPTSSVVVRRRHLCPLPSPLSCTAIIWQIMPLNIHHMNDKSKTHKMSNF